MGYTLSDDEVALIPWSWYNEIDKNMFKVVN